MNEKLLLHGGTHNPFLFWVVCKSGICSYIILCVPNDDILCRKRSKIGESKTLAWLENTLNQKKTQYSLYKFRQGCEARNAHIETQGYYTCSILIVPTKLVRQNVVEFMSLLEARQIFLQFEIFEIGQLLKNCWRDGQVTKMKNEALYYVSYFHEQNLNNVKNQKVNQHLSHKNGRKRMLLMLKYLVGYEQDSGTECFWKSKTVKLTRLSQFHPSRCQMLPIHYLHWLAVLALCRGL